jgi:hypothetical protein
MKLQCVWSTTLHQSEHADSALPPSATVDIQAATVEAQIDGWSFHSLFVKVYCPFPHLSADLNASAANHGSV